MNTITKVRIALNRLLLASWRRRSSLAPSNSGKFYSGGGSVIHITSNECIRPSLGLGTYSNSKGAMVTMTQVCDREWAPDQIRVNCIVPGLVRTELAQPLVKMVEKSGHYQNALKRIGNPSEIAGVALYLATRAGAYATGQTFVVDGGEHVCAPLYIQ